MQINTKRRRGIIAAAAVAAVAIGSFGAAGAVSADPIGSPTNRSLAGVGSDTTQDLYNGLSQVVTNSGGTKILGSYDATGSATIQPKSGGAVFNRPNGSGSGVTALRSAKDVPSNTVTTPGPSGPVNLAATDLQFARSSSGATFVANGALSYIPIALDAVTFAKGTSAAAPNNIPLGTSSIQDTDGDGILDLTLRNIYTRNATTTLETSTGTTYTVGNQASGAQIVPFKPQPGSGTLSFWTSTIGGSFGSIVSDTFTYSTTSTECATNPTITTGVGTFPQFNAGTGVCTSGVQEHNGKVTQRVANGIVPFSIAQHIAQGNSMTIATNYGVTVTDRRFGATLGQVDSIAPLNGSGALNTAFPVRRPVFTVVQFSELATNTNLRNTFQGPTATAYTATRPSAPSQLVITDFGFGNLAGGVTINGVTYTPGDHTSFRTN